MKRYNLSTRLSWARTRTDLEETFRKWAIQDWNIVFDSHDVRGRRRNPDSGYFTLEERTVTLRYTHPSGKEVRLSTNKQQRPGDNLRVLYLTLESLRLNEERGLAETMADAYLQLAAPTAVRDPYEVLGVRPDAPLDVIDAAYVAGAKRLHPDAGGSNEAMKELNEAFDRIKGERA